MKRDSMGDEHRRMTERTRETDPAEAQFDRILGEVLHEAPAVKPSTSFMENVLAALPPPVVVPELSVWRFRAWALGGVGIAAVAAWLLWYQRDLWMDRLYGAQIAAFDLTYLFHQLGETFTASSAPLVTLLGIALIGVAAWGATASAETG